jgi:hypothetical protein
VFKSKCAKHCQHVWWWGFVDAYGSEQKKCKCLFTFDADCGNNISYGRAGGEVCMKFVVVVFLCIALCGSMAKSHSFAAGQPSLSIGAGGLGRYGRARVPWSAVEDAYLLRFVANSQEPIDWTVIAIAMRNRRTVRECRERYQNYLDSATAFKPWTEEEDRILLAKYVELGSNWAMIAAFFPGRKDVQVKSRYNILAEKSFESPSNAALRAQAPRDVSAIVGGGNGSSDEQCLPRCIQVMSNTTPAVTLENGEGPPVPFVIPMVPSFAPVAPPEAMLRLDLVQDELQLLPGERWDEAVADFLRLREEPAELLLHEEPLGDAAEDFLRPLGGPAELQLPGESGYWDYHGA